MTIAQTLNIPKSKHDYVTEYFSLEQMDPDTWTYPVSDKGIEGIEGMTPAEVMKLSPIEKKNLTQQNVDISLEVCLKQTLSQQQMALLFLYF